MFDKLAALERRYDDLLHRLGSGELQSDPAEYRKQSKALAEIQSTVERFREYKSVVKNVAETEELMAAGDPDMTASQCAPASCTIAETSVWRT